MKLTVGVAEQIIVDYLKNRDFSKHTVIRYTKDFRIFCRWFASELDKDDLRDVTPRDITAFREYIFKTQKKGKQRFCLATQRGMLHHLARMFKLFARNEHILTNPFEKLDLKIEQVNKQREVLPVEDMERFLDSIQGTHTLDIRDRALFELMYGTGLRTQEVCNLILSDIDLHSGKLLVREGKGRKDRFVPLGNNCIEHLNRYVRTARKILIKQAQNQQYKELLFLTVKGTPMTSGTVRHSLCKRLQKSGLHRVKLSPHVLRHSFATHMLENGAGIKHVKDILGHESMQTTVIYTHFNVKSLKRILKQYHPRENEIYKEIENEAAIIRKLID